jgi:hypothetical protein
MQFCNKLYNDRAECYFDTLEDFKKCKQLFEYHHLLLFRNIWW